MLMSIHRGGLVTCCNTPLHRLRFDGGVLLAYRDMLWSLRCPSVSVYHDHPWNEIPTWSGIPSRRPLTCWR